MEKPKKPRQRKNSKTTRSTAEYAFGGISELPYQPPKAPERDLAKELFGDKTVTQKIDEYEKAMGFGGRKEVVPPPEKKKVRILDLDKTRDQELMGELMNDPKYKILQFQHHFMPSTGRIRALVIYSVQEVSTSSSTKDSNTVIVGQ